jgi:hypothetical protein
MKLSKIVILKLVTGARNQRNEINIVIKANENIFKKKKMFKLGKESALL